MGYTVMQAGAGKRHIFYRTQFPDDAHFMKALFDFLPIVLFFAAYKLYDIMVATVVAMVAAVGLAAWGWFKNGRIEPMHLFSAGLILLFGGATLLLDDIRFIKLKPTVLYVVLGVVFLVSQFSARTMTERMYGALGDQVPVATLRHINGWWVGFFLLLGVLNTAVAMRFDTETWVYFKLFGLLGLTLVFVLAQAIYLSRFMGDDDAEPSPEASPAPPSKDA